MEEYRNFIYGVKRSNTPTYQRGEPVKKSSSFGKLSSGATLTGSIKVQEKEVREKQTLKFVKSNKDVLRSMHSYNKSTEFPASEYSGYSSVNSSK